MWNLIACSRQLTIRANDVSKPDSDEDDSGCDLMVSFGRWCFPHDPRHRVVPTPHTDDLGFTHHLLGVAPDIARDKRETQTERCVRSTGEVCW